MERILRDALMRGPSCVSFSGGRDSSLVLAVACHVARREGLALPAAVTLRHPSPSSREEEWQELVIAHLGIDDWIKVDVGTSLDLLGDAATGILRSCGVLAPPNAYAHARLLDAARAETIITGVGGDEILSAYTRRLPQVLWGRRPPRPGDVGRLALAASPRAARRAWHRRRRPLDARWLTASAREEVSDRLADSEAAVRLRWDTDARMWIRSRTTALFRSALVQVAGTRDARAVSPLADDDFVESFAALVGPAGPVGRTESMRMLGGDLLPEAVLSRSSKAVFDEVVWGPRFAAFTARWDPTTLDPTVAQYVDVEEVLRDWREDPSYGTATLVQQAWLDQQGHGSA